MSRIVDTQSWTVLETLALTEESFHQGVQEMVEQWDGMDEAQELRETGRDGDDGDHQQVWLRDSGGGGGVETAYVYRVSVGEGSQVIWSIIMSLGT